MRKSYTEVIKYVTYDYDDDEEFIEHKKVMARAGYGLTDSYRLGRGLVVTYSKQLLDIEGRVSMCKDCKYQDKTVCERCPVGRITIKK